MKKFVASLTHNAISFDAYNKVMIAPVINVENIITSAMLETDDKKPCIHFRLGAEGKIITVDWIYSSTEERNEAYDVLLRDLGLS